ncbi:MAG TPA: response regulator [Candidatus Acidoferrales bacterium]|nr:response regulator [Candidatus Acidoferrales bacterium]
MQQILVVDDDLDILDALRFVLEDSGYTVETTQNGDDVEKLITEKKQPKLIILDVLLSGIDGREICRKLKMNKKTKQIPIMMISAHPAIKKSILEAGADAFIAKPFDIMDLLQKVNELIEPQ